MSYEKQGLPPAYEAPLATTAPPPNQSFLYTVTTTPLSSQPPDYLVLSIFSILCCFWPLGIIALLKSIETRKHSQEGRQAEAEASSKEAKLYNSIAIGIGIAINVVAWLLVLVSFVVPFAIVAVVASNQ